MEGLFARVADIDEVTSVLSRYDTGVDLEPELV